MEICRYKHDKEVMYGLLQMHTSNSPPPSAWDHFKGTVPLDEGLALDRLGDSNIYMKDLSTSFYYLNMQSLR